MGFQANNIIISGNRDKTLDKAIFVVDFVCSLCIIIRFDIYHGKSFYLAISSVLGQDIRICSLLQY